MLPNQIECVLFLYSQVMCCVSHIGVPQQNLATSQILGLFVNFRWKCSSDWMGTEEGDIPSTFITPSLDDSSQLNGGDCFGTTTYWCEDEIAGILLRNPEPPVKGFYGMIGQFTQHSFTRFLHLYIKTLPDFSPICFHIWNLQAQKIVTPERGIHSSIEKCQVAWLVYENISQGLNLFFAEWSFFHFYLSTQIYVRFLWNQS